MKPIFTKTVLQGQIPHLMLLKRIIFWVAVVFPFSIFLSPRMTKDFADYGWNILIAVMLIRPLADIFPGIGILKTLVAFRKEFGILAALLLIGHFIGYVLVRKDPIVTYLSPSSPCFWGIIGIAFAVPVLISSNKAAMIFLKGWWKPIQSLSYALFLFGGVHIASTGEGSGLAGIIIVSIAWLLAHFNIKINSPAY